MSQSNFSACQLSIDLIESGFCHPNICHYESVHPYICPWLIFSDSLFAGLFPCFGRLSKMYTQYIRKGIAKKKKKYFKGKSEEQRSGQAE